MLSGFGVSYESLCAKSIYNNQANLRESLDTLDMIGLLTAQANVEEVTGSVNYPNRGKRRKPDRFSQMLRSFISSSSGKK